MERDSLRAAGDMVTRALERSHDAAHVSGRVAEEMRALKRMTEAERVDLIVFRCRESAALHRDTAVYFAELLMWMRQHDRKEFMTVGGTVYTRALAEKEYGLARHFHRRVCAQLGHWLAQQAQHQRADAPLDLPPAANCDSPNSSTASTAA
ncbi:hypothetical protein ACIU1J_27500 [Azospirillum doebereinerae]|uniref:hypothetical protein n=1 Tax=Azospirillum doebereinerae TaxID=92933 RepID=UPI001EE55CBB|nr:hypothetical protein [Azospirillum doebereinerae]MCG5241365.1 hypothetical protein [Azospirillum doebereinerae]